MEEDAFNLDAKLSIGDGDDDRFKDEDVEEEKAPGPAAGSAKKPKKKTPIKTSNAGAQEASTADAKPIDREQQRKLQLAADQENAADLFGTRRPRRDSGRSRVQGSARPAGRAAVPLRLTRPPRFALSVRPRWARRRARRRRLQGTRIAAASAAPQPWVWEVSDRRPARLCVTAQPPAWRAARTAAASER